MTTITERTMQKEFQRIRSFTETLVAPLEIEDFVIQAESFVSPAKWHLAHTTWFFETFILKEFYQDYQEFHQDFAFLFNSYYESIGAFHPQRARGLITRPTVSQTFAYRHYVNEHMIALLGSNDLLEHIRQLTEIGLNHEQQHQELILTDLKYNFSFNPSFPIYIEKQRVSSSLAPKLEFIELEGGLVELGHDGQGFSFDNEGPLHKVWLNPYRLANRPITNGEYAEFIEDEGYQNPAHWLSDGWNTVKSNNWKSPLYWKKRDGAWYSFTLSGLLPLDEHAPVSHLSFYEADAFARWAGKRLPFEHEWENAFREEKTEGNFAEKEHYEPISENITDSQRFQKGYGDVWEWTQSAYSPYPGNKPLKGALGEYNAKFMANQIVLRGGSCATPASHIRATYRNFFYPHMRWQFSGLRLAEDCK